MAKKGSTIFADAVSPTKLLQIRIGLSAIKKQEGKSQISAKNTRHILGSICIDDDCCVTYPNDNRWDYAVGYDRNNSAHVHFIEVHSANSSSVGEVERKLDWLQNRLNSDWPELNALPKNFHWVASGKFNIPRHVPQYRKLKMLNAKRKLSGPATMLVLQ